MTTINNKDKYEYVSIAMDNEDLSDEMLDKLLADDEAGQKWYEYHLISDCMKQQAVGRNADFMQSEVFTAALAEISREHQANYAANASNLTSKQSKASNHAFKGFAAAASLAAVAVSVWQFWPQADTQQMTPVAVEKQQQQVDQNIVPVRAVAENKAASDVVVPNAAEQLSIQKQQNTAVRVESQAVINTPPKEIVQ
ncbi:sigma-E factor negative regulatory protein [Neisseria weixii]|uniref:Anti-sigma factor n=1 Tax=Neisseria weixii TaxID=1853276 RepID=A0A3N4MQ72_9NEIS|nr:sigma-E factor negative regulatory protein [Neisseria weixii]ATD65112.1 anti-sigma factor [Neisseria weixii]RPD85984.1 anti-sigma factor [Neisseria weixii]RPD86722.1 anti-sigma factor [Neisseria weixii]